MASPVQVNGVTGVLATPIFVRAGACDLCGYSLYNSSTGTAFVQFYDSALAPTVGTTVSAWSVGMATATPSTLAFQISGLRFVNGLWVAATTTAAGTGAPSAGVAVSLDVSC